jgi:antirestriction protein ArdC
MENKIDTPTQSQSELTAKKITPREKYNQVVENFISKLENNDIEPWTKSWNMSSALPKNFETGNRYQGMNILTLMERGFSDSRFLTFNQIKKLKGSVKQGEKSSPIFFMKPIEQQERNQENGEIETKKYFMMKSYNVFNIEQTEGISYEPEVPQNNNNTIPAIKSFIENIGIEEYRGAPAYSPKDDCIFMPELGMFENESEFYATYFHELTHATGHEKRLDRFEKNTTYGNENYAYEELIAELGSAFLSLEHGIAPNSKKQAAYLKSWITALKEKPQILYSAASKATQSTTYLLDTHEMQNNLKLQYGEKIDLSKSLQAQSKKVVVQSSKPTSPSPKIA